MNEITRFPILIMKTGNGYELRHNKASRIYIKPDTQSDEAFYDYINGIAFRLAVKLNANAVTGCKWYSEQNLEVISTLA